MGHYTIGDILRICKQHGLYGIPGNNEVGTSSDDEAGTSGDDAPRQPFWLDALRLDANAPADREIALALFFNKVLACAKQACSTVECL